MDQMTGELQNLLKQFQLAISTAGPAQPLVLKAFQAKFSSWAAAARAKDASGYQYGIALAEDIADQSPKHIDSLMVRVNAALKDPNAAPAGAGGGIGILVVALVVLFLLK